MHTVVLSTANPPADKNSHLWWVWKGMTEALEHKSRVYRTYIDDVTSREQFTLVTTSKDLHLKLGSFDWQYNYHLAKCLEEEFKRCQCSQLLLCFEDAVRNSEKGILVTMTAKENEITFTLALAR
ncbi:MAG: hypothetical protein PHD04_00565 [Candidatus Pacebacteria bacterium]|nr:hypothetical protein [Candidatus Paceibacterota bacterium]